jgi:hypothetical protein
VHAGVRQRVHLLHYERRLVHPLVHLHLMMLSVAHIKWQCSVREVPAGETKDRQRGRHSLCYDVSWIRELRRGSEDLLEQVPRSKYLTPSSTSSSLLGKTILNSDADWDETQSARGDQAQRPGSRDDPTGFTTTAGPSGTIPAANYGEMNNAIGGGAYGMGGGEHDPGVGPSQYAMGPAVTNGTNSY